MSKQQGFDYNKKRVKKRIMKLWSKMDWGFFHKEKDWYWNCRKWCQELADDKGLDLMHVVSVFSALSPQNSYASNKMFCEAYFAGIKKHTNVQHGKALEISLLFGIDMVEVRRQRILEILSGEKTKDFFLAIMEPYSPNVVVVDRHMLVIAGVDKPTVTKKQYDFLKECYLEIAKELSLPPCELQASLWCWYRKQKFSHDSYG